MRITSVLKEDTCPSLAPSPILRYLLGSYFFRLMNPDLNQTPGLPPSLKDRSPFVSHNSGNGLHSQFPVLLKLPCPFRVNIYSFTSCRWTTLNGRWNRCLMRDNLCYLHKSSYASLERLFLNYKRNSFSYKIWKTMISLGKRAKLFLMSPFYPSHREALE